jgi:hypothetical protein
MFIPVLIGKAPSAVDAVLRRHRIANRRDAKDEFLKIRLRDCPRLGSHCREVAKDKHQRHHGTTQPVQQTLAASVQWDILP